MPPVRAQLSAPAKVPMKSERSHSENQERAYIAASRRSDRSLEARVESARRASEVHKERTGRSLKVTEQDVLNEEMYEEEDDDLPLQYRRLTAHLHTSSTAFNRRLAAYLTNHVAMREALGEAMHQHNSPNFHQYNPQAGQPWSPTGQPFSPQAFPMQSPNMMPPSPNAFRQSPYPTPFPQNYTQANFKRSASTAGLEDGSTHPQAGHADFDQEASTEKRRKSTSTSQQTNSDRQTPQLTSESPPVGHPRGSTSSSPCETQAKPSLNTSAYEMSQQANLNPFSMALPPEAQGFFSPYHSRNTGTNYSQYGPPNLMSNDSTQMSSKLGGMSQTLAPSALHNSKGGSGHVKPNLLSTSDNDFTYGFDPSAPSSGYDFESQQDFGSDEFQALDSKYGVENGTGDDFGNFINTDLWDDNSIPPSSWHD